MLHRIGTILCSTGQLRFLPDRQTLLVRPGVYWVMVRDDDVNAIIFSLFGDKQCQPPTDDTNALLTSAVTTQQVALTIYDGASASEEDLWDGTIVTNYAQYKFPDTINKLFVWRGGAILDWKVPAPRTVTIYGQPDNTVHEALRLVWQ